MESQKEDERSISQSLTWSAEDMIYILLYGYRHLYSSRAFTAKGDDSDRHAESVDLLHTILRH